MDLGLGKVPRYTNSKNSDGDMPTKAAANGRRRPIGSSDNSGAAFGISYPTAAGEACRRPRPAIL